MCSKQMKCVQTLLLATVLLMAASVQGHVDLQGHWKEDQYQRTGLNDFLYYMGNNLGLDTIGLVLCLTSSLQGNNYK